MSWPRIPPGSKSAGPVKSDRAAVSGKPAPESAVRPGQSQTGGGIPLSEALPGSSGKNIHAGPVFPRKVPAPGKDGGVFSSTPPGTNFFFDEPLHDAAAKDAAGKNAAAKAASGISVVPAKELFSQTALALGLPKDGLSTTLLAFLRLFSVTPSAALAGKLRREVLDSLKISRAGAADGKVSPEAEALAAVSAACKGVVLSPETLEHYARFFVLPPSPEKDGDSKRDDAREEKDRSRDSGEPPEAGELNSAAREEAAKDKVLAFLNSLPGKNGQYWTVYPLDIKLGGTELRIFIRILKRELSSRREGDFLITDIAGPRRGWRCYVKKTGGKYRADIRIFPGLAPAELALLEKEAEKFLGEGAGVFGDFRGFSEIRLRNGEEAFSWAEELGAENFPALDKEV